MWRNGVLQSNNQFQAAGSRRDRQSGGEIVAFAILSGRGILAHFPWTWGTQSIELIARAVVQMWLLARLISLEAWGALSTIHPLACAKRG
jgi:hypothetical protein